MVKAVRGATSVSKNRGEEILSSVTELVSTLIKVNNIEENQIVSIQFSVTRDLQAVNPATALRTIGFSNVPLFCSQEPKIRGALKRIVRVMITLDLNQDKKLVPIYLGEAKKLRPDLVKDEA